MLETSKNPLSTPIIGAPLGNNYKKEAPGQILERIWRVPVVQQAFFQRASKDGVTQRGERIVLFWVTGRDELRRTSARRKNTFFYFFSGRRRGPYILVYFVKAIRFLFFFASCTQKKLRISVARRDDEKRAPKQNGAAQSLSKNETPNPGPNPTHFRQFVRKNQRRQCREKVFLHKERVRVTPNIFIVDYWKRFCFFVFSRCAVMVDLQEPRFPTLFTLAPDPMFWMRILLRSKNEAPLISMFLDAK